jgi:hypothetical protein
MHMTLASHDGTATSADSNVTINRLRQTLELLKSYTLNLHFDNKIKSEKLYAKCTNNSMHENKNSEQRIDLHM